MLKVYYNMNQRINRPVMDRFCYRFSPSVKSAARELSHQYHNLDLDVKYFGFRAHSCYGSELFYKHLNPLAQALFYRGVSRIKFDDESNYGPDRVFKVFKTLYTKDLLGAYPKIKNLVDNELDIFIEDIPINFNWKDLNEAVQYYHSRQPLLFYPRELKECVTFAEFLSPRVGEKLLDILFEPTDDLPYSKMKNHLKDIEYSYYMLAVRIPFDKTKRHIYISALQDHLGADSLTAKFFLQQDWRT